MIGLVLLTAICCLDAPASVKAALFIGIMGIVEYFRRPET